MNELDIARQTIDEVDREMAKLFQRRMEAGKVVAEYKASHGLPIFDAAREKRVIEKNALRVENPLLRTYYVDWLQNLMDVSKRYQQTLLDGMLVAFCGVVGAFGNIASSKIFPHSRLVSYPDFGSAYDAVVNGDCDCCVLPIENSYAGEVGQVIDLMFEGSLYVNGVYDLPVKQNLLGVKGSSISQIKKVISHPQALSQCNVYIKEHGFEAESASNTAVAAKEVAAMGDPTIAAIASKTAAERFGLDLLDHDINESAVNTTRFAVFSKARNDSYASSNSFILMFTVPDESGALAKALNVICAHEFNMSVLRSRPVKDEPWTYYFYCEAMGDQNSEEGKRMLKELDVCCGNLKVVGHYSDIFTIEE